MYPTTIPIKNGIIFINPFPLTITIAVVKNVINATATPLQSISAPVESPIWEIALGANPNPIIIIIGPITSGGNNLLIQFFPISFTTNANTI